MDPHRFLEQRSIDYVPLAERHGKVWHLWPVWFSGDAHLATVATGIVGIALGGNFAWMALAVVLGSAFGTFFMAFHSTQGPQLGLPQMIQSRPQFGYLGALLVWGVALIAYIGFNSFNQVLAAQTMHALYGAPPAPTMLGFTLLSLGLAVVGYDLIHLAQRYVAYVLIGALLVFTAAVAVKAPLSLDAGAERVSRGALSRAILCGRLLPDRVVHLRVGLFALPAARCRRERLLLVDLSRRLRGRLVDHAGGHHRRGALSKRGSRLRHCAPRPTPCCPDSASRCCCARCSAS